MKHSFMRIARGLAPKLTFGAFALSAMLAACGDDSSSAYDQSGVVAVNNKTVSGVS